MIQIYDRQRKEIYTEEEYGKGALQFLYHTVPGRILLKLFVERPAFSRKRAAYYRSSKSVRDIELFIKKYHVDMTGYRMGNFRSFNDFFTRKRKVTDSSKTGELVAPADSKLAVYEITDELKLKIKNSVYSVEDILQDKILADKYQGGMCLVFRLSVDDYHRFHFIDDGRIRRYYKIPGVLHTVRSISERYHVFSANAREVTVMDTAHFGEVTEVDVGALLVGKIHNRKTVSFHKLMEKGYFEYGGSTVVLLMENGVKIDSDICEMSRRGIECKVRIGERIGGI